jgi:hypothetical protein
MTDRDRLQQQRIDSDRRNRQQEQNREDRLKRQASDKAWKDKKEGITRDNKKRSEIEKQINLDKQNEYNKEQFDKKTKLALQVENSKIERHRKDLEFKERVEKNKKEMEMFKQRAKIATEEIKVNGTVSQSIIAKNLQEQIMLLDQHYFVERENVYEEGRRYEFEREIVKLEEILNNNLELEKSVRESYKQRLKEDFKYKQLEMLLSANLEKIMLRHRTDVEIKIIEVKNNAEKEIMILEADLKYNEVEQYHRHKLEFENVQATEDIRKHTEKGVNDYVIRKVERDDLDRGGKAMFAQFEQEYQEEIKAKEEGMKEKLSKSRGSKE